MKTLILCSILLFFVGCASDTTEPNSISNVPSQSSCCKTCTKGKACGDSCISKDKTCNVGKGCACDG